MNISLTKELEILVSDKVKSGRYHSASEVIREGLRLLEEQDMKKQAQIEWLRKEAQIGIDEIERGEYTTYRREDLKQMFEDLKTQAQQELLEESSLAT